MDNINLSSIIEKMSDFITTLPGILTVVGLVILLIALLIVLIIKNKREGGLASEKKNQPSNSEISELDKNLELLEETMKSNANNNNNNNNNNNKENNTNTITNQQDNSGSAPNEMLLNEDVSADNKDMQMNFTNESDISNGKIEQNPSESNLFVNEGATNNDLLLKDDDASFSNDSFENKPVDQVNLNNFDSTLDTKSDMGESNIQLNNTNLNDEMLKPIAMNDAVEISSVTPDVVDQTAEPVSTVDNNLETSATLLQPISVDALPETKPELNESVLPVTSDTDYDEKIETARELNSTIEIPSIDFANQENNVINKDIENTPSVEINDNPSVKENEEVFIKGEEPKSKEDAEELL